MKIEVIKESYPKLFGQLPEDVEELRSLIVIDENENDGDVDELDEVDAEDYNYIVYLTETLQEIIGEEKEMISLIRKLDEREEFEDFFPSEIDLYGIKTEHEEMRIAHAILDTVEKMLP